MKVLFVCTGNVCRSPMAQVIFENLAKENGADIKVASAGTMTLDGLPMTPTAKKALKECGQKMGRKKRASTQFRREFLDEYDHIVTMTAKHADVIGEHPNVYTLDSVTHCGDIWDPFMQPLDIYVSVCRQLMAELGKLYEIIGGVG